MSYNSEYFSKAISIKQQRKKKRDNEYNAKLNALYSAVDELKAIETELSQIGARAMNAAILGKTDEVEKLRIQSDALTEKKNEILKAAGLEEPKSECSLCGDTGYVGAKVCDCVRALAKELVFSDLSSKMPIANQTFTSFSLDYYNGEDRKVMSGIYEFAKKYAEDFSTKSENLLFLGGVGLGKTHLSLSIINAVTEKGFGVVYDSAQNLLNKIEKEHFSYSGSSEIIDAVLSCDLLVVDDLGTEFITSFTVSQLYNIINSRINSGLPTIINTNLDFAEIEKNYTPRILSRIMGSYKIKKFMGDDIRIKKALNK